MEDRAALACVSAAPTPGPRAPSRPTAQPTHARRPGPVLHHCGAPEPAASHLLQRQLLRIACPPFPRGEGAPSAPRTAHACLAARVALLGACRRRSLWRRGARDLHSSGVAAAAAFRARGGLRCGARCSAVRTRPSGRRGGRTSATVAPRS
eukprot:scaffold40_cov305-Pinguiococcus_pyrenoidosus.AAC.27